MPKLDLTQAPVKTGSIYPDPYSGQMAGRTSLRLGRMAGLTQFGANLVTLQPGAKASLRHWHLKEDEFAIITKGSCTLVDDDGRHAMNTGDCAAFPAGDPNAHHFVNETDAPMEFLVIGTSDPQEIATYGDVDLKITMNNGEPNFTYWDGTPFAGEKKND